PRVRPRVLPQSPAAEMLMATATLEGLSGLLRPFCCGVPARRVLGAAHEHSITHRAVVACTLPRKNRRKIADPVHHQRARQKSSSGSTRCARSCARRRRRSASMVGPVIIAFGSDAQKKRFLPRIANLDDWWCQGFSEPGSGSDLASLKTSAKRVNGN